MIFKKSFAVICALSLALVSFSPAVVVRAGEVVELKSQGFSMDLPVGFSGADYRENNIVLYDIDDGNSAEIGFFDVPANWDSSQAAKHLVVREYIQLSVAAIFMSAFTEDEEYNKFIEMLYGLDVSYEDVYIAGRKFTKINFNNSFNPENLGIENNAEISSVEKVYYITVKDGNALYVIADQSSADRIISTINWRPTINIQPSTTQKKLQDKYSLTISYPWLVVDDNILSVGGDNHGYFIVNRENPNVFGIVALNDDYTQYTEESEGFSGVVDINSNRVERKISGSTENYFYSDLTLIKKIRVSNYSLLKGSDNISFGLFTSDQSLQGQQSLINNFENLISTLRSENIPVVEPVKNPEPEKPVMLEDNRGDFSVISPVKGSDHILGNFNAPVTLLVYTDFQTPFYVRHYETLKQLMEHYGDKVRIVFRHYPLTSIHPNAQKAAEASVCAEEQGKFWEYHDILLKSQDANGVADLKKYASQLNLNQKTFDACLDSGVYSSRVAKNAREAEAYGINGIPSTFVNGKFFAGAYPYDTFKIEIDNLLYVELNPDNKIENITLKFVNQEKSFVSKVNQGLINRIQGRILLQVEGNGEAWYLDPVSKQKYYLRDGDSAYQALRKFGLGVSNQNLRKIPIGFDERLYQGLTDSDGDGLPDKLEEAIGTDSFKADTDGDGYNDKTEVLSSYNPIGSGKWEAESRMISGRLGRILLQVESRGEAWYINPTDGKRYFLGDGNMSYQIMRFLSLGIKNAQLREIPVGDL